MIDRFRDQLDRPLDRGPAQAIVTLAALVTLAFGVLIALGIVGQDPSLDAPRARPILVRPSAPARPSTAPSESPAAGEDTPVPTQDPQDRPGTGPYRRALEATESHRAMQHLPYHRRGIEIAVVGADHGRAIIRVTARTIAQARRGWAMFLRRYGDDGGAYVARFHVGARNGITGRREDAGGAALGAARPDGSAKPRSGGNRRRATDRGGRRNLRSKPHPKASQ